MSIRHARWAVALLLIPGLGVAGGPRVSGSGVVAVGVNDNLNAAVAAEEKVGSVYGHTAAGVALLFGSPRYVARMDVRYAGRAFAYVPTLSWHAVGVGAGAQLAPAHWVSLSLMAEVQGRWVAEQARQSLGLGASVSLVFKPARILAIPIGYDFDHRFAVDEVFGGSGHQGHLGLEFRLARRTYLGAEYALGWAPIVRYETVVVPSAAKMAGTGDRKQTPSSTFEEMALAVQIPALSHGLVVQLEQGIIDQLYVKLMGGITWLYADDELSVEHFGQLSLGFRAP